MSVTKPRKGFCDWMADENVFDIEIDLSSDMSKVYKNIYDTSVVLFMRATESERDKIRDRFDARNNMKVV